MLKIRNGKIWRDTKGNVIHCHGGGFLKQGDFYWFEKTGSRAGWFPAIDLWIW